MANIMSIAARRQPGQPGIGQPLDLSPEAIKRDFSSYFGDKTYADSPALQNVLGQIVDWAKGYLNFNPNAYNEGWRKPAADIINQYASTFGSMFKDKVGRDPTAEEYDTFINHVVGTEDFWKKAAAPDPTVVQEKTRNSLTDYFTDAFLKSAEDRARTQAEKAVGTGSPFESWANQYRSSIGGLEQQLSDYSTRVMEKIRPQLLTSLKSQGLLDSGALTESLAGVTRDLGQTAQDQIANARMASEQDINNTRFKILGLPFEQQASYSLNEIPNFLSQGENSLNRTWQSYMSDKDFNRQMALLDAQKSDSGSPLEQYAGLMLGGLAGGFGQGYGQRLGRGV